VVREKSQEHETSESNRKPGKAEQVLTVASKAREMTRAMMNQSPR
jgi:hypothetical protein